MKPASLFAVLGALVCLPLPSSAQSAVPIPVNAIGGLNKTNIDVLCGIPIAGICVVSAIMKADDPRQAAVDLRDKAKELGIL